MEIDNNCKQMQTGDNNNNQYLCKMIDKPRKPIRGTETHEIGMASRWIVGWRMEEKV